MSERDVIERTRVPATVDSLSRDLLKLGLKPGVVLLVHASMSQLGWICGGAVSVIEALQRVLGPEGTLIMPAYAGGLTDPKNWQHPPVPEDWKETIRAHTPAFDPGKTPTRKMGAIAETFRTWPDVHRSYHPHCSFAAWGRYAIEITANHPLDNGLGEASPLERIYERSGWILLLGVGFGNNTSLHLSEHRANYPGKEYEINGAPMLVEGVRRWVPIRDLCLDSEDFPTIGEAFTHDTSVVQKGRVGEGEALLMPQAPLVDYGVQWMESNRTVDVLRTRSDSKP